MNKELVTMLVVVLIGLIAGTVTIRYYYKGSIFQTIALFGWQL